MLTKATLADITQYCDFIYNLALDQTKSSYPTYADGIKTKADFIADTQQAVTKANSELLLFSLDGVVEGWIRYFWIPEDHYLQLCACNIRRETGKALEELLTLLTQRFPGYTLYFGFPGCNTEAISFLRKNGFQCIEEAWNHSFFLDNYSICAEENSIARINRSNYDDFRAVYKPDADTYWNCDRILAALDEWSIFVYYKNSIPTGTIFFQGDNGYYEIFGIEFADGEYQDEICQALLTAALNHCKHLGAKYMTFFCEEAYRKVVSELGFCCVGQYICYIKTV